jgi:thiamine biosynthesis lipoprotein
MLRSLSDAGRRLAAKATMARPPAGWMQRDDVHMGTAIHVELWADSPAQGREAIDAVMAEMQRIDWAMSPVKPSSELARINREAHAGPVPVSTEMFDLLTRAQAFSRFSDGAFDITFASVGDLYDYRAGVAPDDAAVDAARAAVGWWQLELDPASRSVRFAREGMRIDLGGFAKGHAVDRAARLVAGLGIQHAIVSAGGDSRVIGDRLGRPWTVAVADPRQPGRVVAVLPLQDCSVSTSGDYERYFVRNGVRCHHILDPRTGRSPATVRSVTVLADDGLTSEALSKCVFVLGVERGLQLVAAVPGADAVVVDAQGRLHASAGLLNAGQPTPSS